MALLACALALAAGAPLALAHEHHHDASLSFDTGEPIGGVLKAHIVLMSIAFGAL
ncbi:hypothetical protein H4R21_004062, partial [Coemansia helicoidea]